MPLSFTFGNVFALVLLLLLPFVLFIAFKARRRANFPALAVRFSIVTLLVMSLANLQPVVESNRLATVFLVDISDSMGKTGQTEALNYTRAALAKKGEEQNAGVVVFGQNALVAKPVGSGELPADSEITKVFPPGNYTNLAEALRLGMALLPGDRPGRLVLVTDGNQNLDDVRNASTFARTTGVPIDVVTVSRQDAPELSVANVNVPSTLRQGEEFSLKATVDSNYAGNAQLVIYENDKVLTSKNVQLQKGTNLFDEKLTAKEGGANRYRVKINPAEAAKDSVAQNNESQATGLVKGKARVLLVEGHPDQREANNLQNALNQTEIETVTIAPDKFPTLTELAKFDSVVLVNVPNSGFKANNLKDLQTFVKEQGKGLVVVGGEESYGLGGYFRTPLEEMLPLQLQLPQRKEIPSVAMVLVVDRSASMTEFYRGQAGFSGRTKLEVAKDATYLAVQQLGSTDQVGIVVFDTDAKWQVPLSVVGDPTNLQAPIGRIASGGGTLIYSGFSLGLEALKTATATNKHIIILTDGQDLGRTNYDRLISDASNYGVTVSTVGLGRDVNTDFLDSLAKRGNGRFNHVTDPDNLPKIFAKEARMAARSYIVEEEFVPTTADNSAIVKGIAGVPPLKGYVATQPRPNATLALVTKRNEPLLAHWQYGLGRVAAWTSDAKGRWASNWVSWGEFPRFWSQLVRWTVPEAPQSGLQVQTRTVGERIYVSADALGQDSRYLNGLEMKAKVTGARGEEITNLTLVQTAPGRYEGFFVPNNAGTFVVNVEGAEPKSSVGGSGAVVNQNLSQSVGAVANYSPEYRQLGTNDKLLAEIAAQTGGRVLNLGTPETVFRTDFGKSTRPIEIWQWLLLLAVLLFPLDIALRNRTNLFRRIFYKPAPRPAVATVPAMSPPVAPMPVAPVYEPEESVIPSANAHAAVMHDEATLSNYLHSLDADDTAELKNAPHDEADNSVGEVEKDKESDK
jgi:uncharacterized membrane protein